MRRFRTFAAGVRQGARIAAAQLTEARAKLDLLRAGSREEDAREAQARGNSAAAELENARARLAQCSIRAPADGIVVDVLAAQAAQSKSSDVQTVLLNVDRTTATLPIGWPVAVHFSPCPSKI